MTPTRSINSGSESYRKRKSSANFPDCFFNGYNPLYFLSRVS